MPKTTYRDTLKYLYRFTDYERRGLAAYAPEFYDLRRMNHLLALLGEPQRSFRSVHIAGTKGKGATAAMIESVLRSAGHRTGLYTSPHLHIFRERIQVVGELIPEGEYRLLGPTDVMLEPVAVDSGSDSVILAPEDKRIKGRLRVLAVGPEVTRVSVGDIVLPSGRVAKALDKELLAEYLTLFEVGHGKPQMIIPEVECKCVMDPPLLLS